MFHTCLKHNYVWNESGANARSSHQETGINNGLDFLSEMLLMEKSTASVVHTKHNSQGMSDRRRILIRDLE